MGRVVIVGGGWAGCAAAIAAKKAKCEVELFERTDLLLGTGLVGGIMRNNGRFTATEEMIAMGGGELFEITDRVSRHKNIDFPGHMHASLYDVALIEPAVRRKLIDMGINIHLRARVKDVVCEGSKITHIIVDNYNGEKDIKVNGDVFVDTSGTAGPQANCTKYGNGCVMCIYRCPTFGPRISIAAKAGVKEIMGLKADGSSGAMSGSCKLHKESLDKEIVKLLDETGVAVLPVPNELQKGSLSLTQKACQQYALREFNENIILLDTGHAKLMSSYYPIESIRKIPGFENARFEDPYAGGIGNSMRYMGMLPRDNSLKVEGLENVFVGGEKAGLFVGHTEAIVTGTLAGFNATRSILSKPLLTISEKLACGDVISFVKKSMQTTEGLKQKYTFSGSVYFNRMKDKGLYSTDVTVIKDHVNQQNLAGIFQT